MWGGGEGGRGTGGCRVFFIVTCIKVAVFLFFLYTSTSEWHLRNSKAFPNIAVTVGDSVIVCISIMSLCYYTVPSMQNVCSLYPWPVFHTEGGVPWDFPPLTQFSPLKLC